MKVSLRVVWLLAIACPIQVIGQATECLTWFNPTFSMTCLKSFPCPPFSQMSLLRKLSLKGPYPFNSIGRGYFSGFDVLNELTINDIDNLQLVSDNFGPLNRSLDVLSLHNCNLQSMPNNIFCNLNHLQVLNLSYNSISDTNKLGFDHPCERNSSITVLDVSFNNIIQLQSNVTICKHLPSLKAMHLSNNKIQIIDHWAFNDCNNLRVLDLANNNLSTILSTVFESLTDLEQLIVGGNVHLKWNNLHFLLPNLKVLNLVNTRLMIFDLKNDTSNLQKLLLDNNKLTELNSQTLAHFKNNDDILSYFNSLQLTGVLELSISDNCFINFPPIVSQMITLQRLTISYNIISSLDDNDFMDLTELYHLNLTNNNLIFISSNVFRQQIRLKFLYLSKNLISSIGAGAFDNSPLLQQLDLSYNRLQTIVGLFLNQKYLLLILNLSYNRLVNISLYELPLSLAHLNLSHNELGTTGDEFPKHVYLQTLDLSFNNLKTIKYENLPISLVDLYLHNNWLESMEDCTFCATTQIKTITMHNNRLKSIHYHWLRSNHYRGFTTITFINNPLTCDCYLSFFNFYNEGKRIPILLDYKRWKCQRVYFRHASSLSALVYPMTKHFLLDFLCLADLNSTRPLPIGCNAYNLVNGTVRVGACIDTNLTEIPMAFPQTIFVLNFSGNYLPKLEDRTLRNWPNIDRLYLDCNYIAVIDEHAFVNLVDLRELSLRHNLLEEITNDTFIGLSNLKFLNLMYNRVSNIDIDAFKHTPILEHLLLAFNRLSYLPVWKFITLKDIKWIYLYDNPWSCECEFLGKYRDFLQENSRIIARSRHRITCLFSENVTFPIVTFNMTKHCHPNSLTFIESKYFRLMLGLLITTVSIVIMFVLCYIYRREIQILIYSRYGVRIFAKNRDKMDEDRIFDAFIAYSNDDESFLMTNFLPGLQGIPKPYYVCLHHKHFIIGTPITDNISAAVAKSRRTIILLSKNFIRSEFCRYEFKMAYIQMLKDHCNRVIVVVIGELPKDLEPEMNLYLKTNTYLMWKDERFWSKLYFAMPETPRQPLSEDLMKNGYEYTMLSYQNK